MVGWFDRYLVDGLLNVFSAWSLRAGDLLRRIQTGQPQDYLYGVAFGVLIVFLIIAGSIWIIAHLNANLMSMPMN